VGSGVKRSAPGPVTGAFCPCLYPLSIPAGHPRVPAALHRARMRAVIVCRFARPSVHCPNSSVSASSPQHRSR